MCDRLLFLVEGMLQTTVTFITYCKVLPVPQNKNQIISAIKSWIITSRSPDIAFCTLGVVYKIAIPTY